MITGDQLLGDALAGLGGGGIVAPDDLDLDARRQVLLVLLDVEVYAFLHLVAGLGEKSGIAVDQADLDGLRRCRAGDRERGDYGARQGRGDMCWSDHFVSPRFLAFEPLIRAMVDRAGSISGKLEIGQLFWAT